MSKIDTLVSEFVISLRRAIAEEAASAFASVAQGGGGQPDPLLRARKKPGPKPKGAKPAKRSGKRSSEEVLEQAKALLGAIKKTPGANIETLAKAVNISTKDLALPVLKLWEEKSIKTTGQKRGTKYFVK